MSGSRTTELPRMQLHRLLEKHGVDYWCVQQTTFWNSESGSEFLAYQYQVDGVYKLAFKGVNVTPEQVIAATLGCEQELIDLAHNAWSMALCAMQGMPIPAEWGNNVEHGLRKYGINADEELTGFEVIDE